MHDGSGKDPLGPGCLTGREDRVIEPGSVAAEFRVLWRYGGVDDGQEGGEHRVEVQRDGSMVGGISPIKAGGTVSQLNERHDRRTGPERLKVVEALEIHLLPEV